MTALTFLDLVLIVLTTAASWSAPALTRPTLPFCVRVPAARAGEPAIVRARGRYSRGVVLLGAAVFAADDRHWHLAGMVYLNRRDPAVLVHGRVSLYWTLNLGHPVTWAILALIALVAVLAGFGVVDLPTRGR